MTRQIDYLPGPPEPQYYNSKQFDMNAQNVPPDKELVKDLLQTHASVPGSSRPQRLLLSVKGQGLLGIQGTAFSGPLFGLVGNSLTRQPVLYLPCPPDSSLLAPCPTPPHP